MQELNVPSSREPADGLFFERLDAFSGASPFGREWHSKYLFNLNSNSLKTGWPEVIKSVLSDASRILESLCDASGVQSFILAVDPLDSADSGFLGGSLLGREYWRGHRGGGDAGAKAFKVHCLKNAVRTTVSETEPGPSGTATAAMPKVQASRSLKTSLYDGVRSALRSASGVRNAEMKWTNPALLATYGVCLVGWPSDIPAQNPSSLKSHQNKQLLDALENGTMHFVRTLAVADDPHISADPSPGPPPSSAGR
ncbi:hypothetical protein C8J57DRAFT_1290126 [Mycena rebaudengoi]|nr:hypothetical protein C8J57DRAFT_1290126 [Mycena rebaudengoi]